MSRSLHNLKKCHKLTCTFKNFFIDFNLVALITDLYFAGTETTSSTIRWYFLYMAKYPEIQKKVQAEIDFIVPKDRFLEYEDKDKFVFFLEGSVQ